MARQKAEVVVIARYAHQTAPTFRRWPSLTDGLEYSCAFGKIHGFPRVVRPVDGSAAGNHFCGPLAQMVEQLAFNQLVIGSIPIRPTTSFLLPYMPLNSRAIAEVRT